MQRSIAIGLVGISVIGGAGLLAVALSRVVNFAGSAVVAQEDARAAMQQAVDAPRPDVPAVPAPAKPAPQPMAMPMWVWSSNNAGADDRVVLTRKFTLGSAVRDARLLVSADNRARVALDGREIAKSDAWETGAEAEIGELAAGEHVLVIEASNEGGPAGVCAYLDFTREDGTKGRLITDANWEASGAFESSPKPATVVARYGDAPWGMVLGGVDDTERPDIDRAISVAKGFIVEPVFVASPARGSIVSMTVDGRGRLIVSPQYGKMFAITPCADGRPASESKIEPIKPDIGHAHGLLAVDNDLYAVVSRGGPEEQGLWRLRDTDRDGAYDDRALLMPIAKDGGEHGPHQVVLAPDGSLWVVGGNHCAPPEEAVRNSRVPAIWQEDIAFDRIWDPNGHAVGVMAPGGWIARTDRDGKSWELMTIGFRNSYDLAFDEVGRAFTFDSDMEWDMGLPWYRPTRINECASGIDFGWRSGSGKWPEWSPDSFPAAVDVGPASPTGVLAAQGLQFPAPWNEAMFFLDWTYGTMWAGWPTDDSKDASSPKLRIEPFLAGRPLPLTDAVVREGAMYFAVGGRNLPSAVYRVRAEQPIAIKRAPMAVPAALAERRQLEAMHRRLDASAAQAAVERAFAALSSPDAGVRSAARIVLEHQDPALWRARAASIRDPRPSILALVALCRTGSADIDGAPIAAQLAALEFEVRGTPLEKEWLRACELWLLRMASRSTTVANGDALRDAILAHYPAKEGSDRRAELDTHRTNLLAKLGAPQAVAGALAVLERPDMSTPKPIDAALLARGGPYGKAVTDMMANAPSTERIAIAYAVRNAANGWNADYRERFARVLGALRKASGGNSFPGFLARIQDEFLSHAPEAERETLALAAAGRQTVASLPAPRGPGRAWTVESILALAPKVGAGREHAEGLRAFHAAQCSQCHRAGGIGQAGGPDLSGVSRRFSLEDLAIALVEPSRTVSDQYQNTEYRLKDGRTIVGRAVSDAPDAIEVRTSLLSEARERIAKADIASSAPSALSPMPANLVDTLSEGEMLDLLAYLLAGGDAGDRAFMKVDDDGYLELFNGTSLAGFTFDPRFWSLDSGQLVGRANAENPAPHNTFFVWNGETRDFELEVVLKVNGNNSGVQYRSEAFDGVRVRGPQIDAHPASSYVAMCYEEGGRGILAERGTRLVIASDGKRTASPLEGAAAQAPDISDWRTYRVVAKGNTMQHFIDGVPTATVVDDSKERAKGGRIAVQIHSGEPTEVRVRSIRLKRLDK